MKSNSSEYQDYVHQQIARGVDLGFDTTSDEPDHIAGWPSDYTDVETMLPVEQEGLHRWFAVLEHGTEALQSGAWERFADFDDWAKEEKGSALYEFMPQEIEGIVDPEVRDAMRPLASFFDDTDLFAEDKEWQFPEDMSNLKKLTGVSPESVYMLGVEVWLIYYRNGLQSLLEKTPLPKQSLDHEGVQRTLQDIDNDAFVFPVPEDEKTEFKLNFIERMNKVNEEDLYRLDLDFILQDIVMHDFDTLERVAGRIDDYARLRHQGHEPVSITRLKELVKK